MNEIQTLYKYREMTQIWILILIFSTMYTVEPGGCWVSAQSLTEAPVYQPDTELSVDIGDSATLRCCISETIAGIIFWFKQLNRQKPQLMVTVYKTTGETFYNGFHKSRFQIERFSNCFHTTILNTIQSDEAMYYCAVRLSNLQFADGTYLKIKGENVISESETSTPKPALCNNSVVHEATLHGNSIKIISQNKTVLGLGSALGFCALLIIFLTYFLWRRTKSDKINTFTENSSRGMRQENKAEMLNYAAVKFSKKKSKPAERENRSSDSTECVYSIVNKTVR